jgi:Flp pilus assembly protein TadD
LADRIQAAEAAAAANPKDIAKRMELAELYRQNADFAQAESVLREVLKTKPLSADAHYRLGVVLYQKGEIAAGVKEWEKAYQLQPRNYIYMRNLQAYRNPRKFYSALLGEEK